MTDKQEPEAITITDIGNDRNPIVELVYPDDSRLTVGEAETDFDRIVPYPERSGPAPVVWFACLKGGRIAVRINSAFIAGVVHGQLSPEQEAKADRDEYQFARTHFAKKGPDGKYMTTVEELRNVAGSAAHRDAARKAAEEELRARGAAGPVLVQ